MRRLLYFFALVFCNSALGNHIPAFPGAEGAGGGSHGGRGGSVIMVNSLADSGSGTLRACMQAAGPRTCIFKVGGTIVLNSQLFVSSPNLTVAGQTAPGGGIQIRGGNISIGPGAHDMTIRYIRHRRGTGSVGTEAGKGFEVVSYAGSIFNVIVDHCSIGWQQDDNSASYNNVDNITYQWNIFQEPGGPSGNGPEGKAFILGTSPPFQPYPSNQGSVMGNVSAHHNFITSSDSRNPIIAGDGPTEFINNVIYNYGSFGTDIQNRGNGTKVNFIGNVWKAGPGTRAAVALFNGGMGGVGNDHFAQLPGLLFVLDNFSPTRTSSAQSEWAVTNVSTSFRKSAPPWTISGIPVTTAAAQTNVSNVLNNVGATILLNANGSVRNARDAVDTRLVAEYSAGTGTIGNDGNFPVIANGTPPADADLDGMPDVYETSNGLNPNNAADRNGLQASGYTNLEVFLNGPTSVPAAPGVSITSPVNGAVVTGTGVTVSANASDDVAVLGVQFKIDNVNLGAEDTSSPYSVIWNTTLASDGGHTITAVARDASTTTTSASVGVTVNNASQDTTLPTVAITAPANASTVSGAVTVSATASDNIGVVGVRFKYGATNIGLEDTTSPYSVSWDTTVVPNGTYIVTATARDAAGNTKVSTGISVTTSNASVTTFTIGDTEILTAVNDCCNGNLLLAQRESLFQDATIRSISFYVSVASGDLRLGIYDSTGPGGGPGAKRAETPSFTPVVGWNTVNVITPVLLPSDNYWLAYFPSSSFLQYPAESTGGITRQYSLPFGPMPATFDTNATSSTWRWSLYATVTVSTGDTTDPTVSLTAPENGATVSGLVTISATAADNVGVSGVQFKLDGANLQAEDLTSPYSVVWDSSSSADGLHQLTATARDAGSNTTTSAARSVTVTNLEVCP